ncbi:hypothetical protein V8B97DRAFT_1864092 [Scleroderma yunnanense]
MRYLGVQLVLYFRTMQLLLTPRERRKPSSRFYMFFSTAMCVLITIWIVTQVALGDQMWVAHWNYPDGPQAYFEIYASAWYQILGSTALLVLQLMTDGLMIYRCYSIWSNYRVIVLPCVLWLATLVVGILFEWATALPRSNFFFGRCAHIALCYYALITALNILVTAMICYRSVSLGKIVKSQLGPAYASMYFNVVTVVVESLLPFTILGIIFLITLGIGSPIATTLQSVYLMFICISPQLLILRVILQREDAGKAVTTMRFAPDPITVGTLHTVQRIDSDLVVLKDEQEGSTDMGQERV